MTRSSASTHGSTGRAGGRVPAAFDGYPYLVTRIGHSALRHLAVLPRSWPAERLVALARRQTLANRLDTCIVLGPASVVYVTVDGDEHGDPYLPAGVPVVDRLRLASPVAATPEITARRARLRAWADALAEPGYAIGDGLEGGRTATRDDIIRLTGRPGADPHPGLAPCATCGDLAGDFLATQGEGNGDPMPRVIPVHCRCDNHNRCARCGEPLAENRLSAYHFVRASGSVCYHAAYSAFSHRCPDEAGR